MNNIGQRLREERQLKGWSQRDLARQTGVNTDTISGIETAQHEPRPSTLRKLAEGLGIEVRDLFMEPALPKAQAREAGPLEWALNAPDREFDTWINSAPAMELHSLWNQLSEHARSVGDPRERAHILDRTQKAIDQFFKLMPIEDFVDRRPRKAAGQEGQETA